MVDKVNNKKDLWLYNWKVSLMVRHNNPWTYKEWINLAIVTTMAFYESV